MQSRLQRCLDQASEEARLVGSTEVSSPHLLLGLLRERVASAALDRLGVTAARLRPAVLALHDAVGEPGESRPPLSDEATDAIERAAPCSPPGRPSPRPPCRHMVSVLLAHGATEQRGEIRVGRNEVVERIKRLSKSGTPSAPERPPPSWAVPPPTPASCSRSPRECPPCLVFGASRTSESLTRRAHPAWQPSNHERRERSRTPVCCSASAGTMLLPRGQLPFRDGRRPMVEAIRCSCRIVASFRLASSRPRLRRRRIG